MLNNLNEVNKEFYTWIKFKNKWSVGLLIMLITIFLLELYVPIIIHLTAKYYLNNEVVDFANSYTSNLSSDEDKLKALLEWEANNYNPIYGFKHDIPFLPYLFYNKLNFLFCIRTDKDNNPSWVFLSKCGACGESALLYSQLANGINLTSRVIKNPGEDHSWTEVLVDGSWIVIDPSMNAYNLSEDYFSNYKNLSYVYAQYENRTIVDLTKKYTNKTGIIILRMDSNLKNRDINLMSKSLGSLHETEAKCEWKGNLCELEVGSTNYIMIGYSGGIIKNFDKKEFLLEENKIVEITLTPKRLYFAHIVKSKAYITIFLSLFILFMWISIGFIRAMIKAMPRKNRKILKQARA